MDPVYCKFTLIFHALNYLSSLIASLCNEIVIAQVWLHYSDKNQWNCQLINITYMENHCIKKRDFQAILSLSVIPCWPPMFSHNFLHQLHLQFCFQSYLWLAVHEGPVNTSPFESLPRKKTAFQNLTLSRVSPPQVLTIKMCTSALCLW
jgi:hypothetical protein